VIYFVAGLYWYAAAGMPEKVAFAAMSDELRSELSIFDDAGSTVAYNRSKKTVSQISRTMSMANKSNGLAVPLVLRKFELLGEVSRICELSRLQAVEKAKEIDRERGRCWRQGVENPFHRQSVGYGIVFSASNIPHYRYATTED
jgi:hypothetical protein